MSLCWECHEEEQQRVVKEWEKAAERLMIDNHHGICFSIMVANFARRFFQNKTDKVLSGLMCLMEKDPDFRSKIESAVIEMDNEVQELIRTAEEQIEVLKT